MPYDDPDPTDPMTLNGVVFETGSVDTTRDMAECFIEEYFRLGFDSERITKMFQTKGYAGPYMAYQKLGDKIIRSLIDEFSRRWGPRQNRCSVDRNDQGDVLLPVLQQ